MTIHDAAADLAAALLGPDHPSCPALTTSLMGDPATAAYAARECDREAAKRTIIDAACAALHARAEIVAEMARAGKRAA